MLVGFEVKRGGLKVPQKCKYGMEPATDAIVHSEGFAYIPVCKAHMVKGKHDAMNCTPNGKSDPSNIVRITPLPQKKEMEKTMRCAHCRGNGEDIKGYLCSYCGGSGSMETKAVVVTPGGRVGDDRKLGSRTNGVNFIERSKPGNTGSLPRYVRIVRNGLMKDGHSESQATALAIAAMKRWAHGGDGVSGSVQAAASEALAEWEAIKASAHTKSYDSQTEFKRGIEHVRTPAGARRFKEPIGAPIRRGRGGSAVSEAASAIRPTPARRAPAKRVASTAASTAGAKAGSLYPGMHPATARDRAAFKAKVGKPIPPAWTDVHIADDLGSAKLLVRGRDVKGRVQRMYSTDHSTGQAAVKFYRNDQMQKHLDKLDSALERDAMVNDSAAALLLIRKLGMRPGSDRNTGAEKQAHGATNLLAKHATVSGSVTTLNFTGKKGVHIILKTKDPLINKVITDRRKTRMRNDRLFDTNEAQTRAYMQSTGVPAGFLLKDLRTVHANVVALREVEKKKNKVPQTKTEFRRWRREVAIAVSNELGNTPTLALASYINPTVFAKWVQDPDWE